MADHRQGLVGDELARRVGGDLRLADVVLDQQLHPAAEDPAFRVDLADQQLRGARRGDPIGGEVPRLRPGDANADRVAGGRVRLCVNTPTPRSGAVRDAAEIRLATINEGILCLTAIETGIAAAEALDPDLIDKISEVRPITEWVPPVA